MKDGFHYSSSYALIWYHKAIICVIFPSDKAENTTDTMPVFMDDKQVCLAVASLISLLVAQ